MGAWRSERNRQAELAASHRRELASLRDLRDLRDAMASSWWKFSLGGAGTHLFRVKNIGTAEQEVFLDGSPLQAPPDTTTFTGPGACLLELQCTDAGWILAVDGVAAESYNPDTGPLASPAVAWFKFTLEGMGTHHVRVTNIGTGEQIVFLDGAPIDAPPGTMMFTGPGGSLLELQLKENVWVLVADGKVTHQSSPHADPNDPLHVWAFSDPATGAHEVRATRLGEAGQEIHLDGVAILAPPGTTLFTGPGGALLDLQQGPDGSWALLVDGQAVQEASAHAGASEGSWTFLAHTTGTAHSLRVLNIGRKGQEVYLDGALVPAPDGTTMFTGPGGTLLELRSQGHAWALFVDGLGVSDYNARSSTLPATSSHGGGAGAGSALPAVRTAVDTSASLPQGVSFDAETGVYKANIKVQGRFKFLGDFATPAEAHERYLAAKKEFDA